MDRRLDDETMLVEKNLGEQLVKQRCRRSARS